MVSRSLVAMVLVGSALACAAPANATGPGCLGRRATVVGTGTADTLRGTPGRDVIVGLGGRDHIDGRGGRDRICGGPGPDRIHGGGGGDRLLGDDGADTVDGDRGADLVSGGPGEDLCFQGPGGGPTESCAPVIAAAGDIACDPASPSYNDGLGTGAECRMRATSDLLLRTNLSAVLALGDLQYPNGSYGRFLASYDPSWGRVKGITHPVPGNHEYLTQGAADYFTYFGAAAGDPAAGYYGFDLGGWHLVALNSECDQVGGCGPGSPQLAWLRDDLADHPAACTLAYWHRPRFSSDSDHGSDPAYAPFWTALDDAGAELVLNGHAHVYERFGPQTPGGGPASRGIRELVVGTGGKELTGFDEPVPHSEVRAADTFGVLELALGLRRYAWRFVPAAGGAFTDAGSARCR
jgi:Ca2+-binding RTX toxin-like protein